MNARRVTLFLTVLLGGLLLAVAPAFASGGGDHWSIFTELLGGNLEKLNHMWGNSWFEGKPVERSMHVVIGIVVFILAILTTSIAGKKLAQKGDEAILPERTFGFFTLFELIAEGLYGIMNDLMGEKQAKRFFPIIMSLAIFILFSNLLGLIPGFLSATDNLNTTAALATVPFILTHYWGVKEHGFVHYFAHFFGPLRGPAWLPLMILMFFIEIISHFARPLSLAIRLMGNMFGDHAVLGAFLAFGFLLVPLPVMLLGTIVCLVQTAVFCLLSIVYIAMAVEHAEDH